jgi:hypothetical protein
MFRGAQNHALVARVIRYGILIVFSSKMSAANASNSARS